MRARTVVLFVCLIGLVALWVSADVKYTTEMQMAAGMPAMRSTVYVKGQAERRDMNMMGMGEISTITQCAKRQVVTINWKCKLYSVAPMDSEEAAQPMPAAAPPPGRPEPVRQGGVVVVENDVRDTGERQSMFGLQARHVLAKMKMQPKEGACMPNGMEMENDVWLVDMKLAQVECGAKFGERPPPVPQRPGGCRDKFQMVNKGNPTLMHGLPVKATMTSILADGRRQSFVTEIKELSTTTLEASLFEPPADFKQASSQQELYTCAMGGNIAEAMKAAGRAAAPAEAQPSTTKREGVWLIGVVMSDRSGRLESRRLADELVYKINAIDGFAGVRIDSRAAPDIQKEAVEKKCDFLLYGDVAEAKTAGPKIGGLLGRAAGVGGSTEPTHSIRLDYRLTLVDPFDQEVARDGLNHTEKTSALEQAAFNFMERTAERATGDARRWKLQQRR